MAKQKSKTFPMLPVGHWWKLREKFKQSIPGVVTANYLATALDIQPRSARNNILPYLKDMGLIDDDGKTLELAKAWRDDEQYQQVCGKIRDDIYHEELVASVANPSEERPAVDRWFSNHSGVGAVAARKMASIYSIIAEGDISKKPQQKGKKTNTAKLKAPAKAARKQEVAKRF